MKFRYVLTENAEINPLTAAVTSGADPMRPSMTTPAHVPYMHEPIHFEPQILRCSREVKMWYAMHVTCVSISLHTCAQVTGFTGHLLHAIGRSAVIPHQSEQLGVCDYYSE
jgi:hypothetical protein